MHLNLYAKTIEMQYIIFANKIKTDKMQRKSNLILFLCINEKNKTIGIGYLK